MLSTNEIIPFKQFQASVCDPEFGYRVGAVGHNYDQHEARNPDILPTFATAKDHLNWQHKATPWVSVYSTWEQALARARWYFSQHGQNTQVSIAIIDLRAMSESSVLNAEYLLRSGSDAPPPRPWWQKDKLLVYPKIPIHAVVVVLPANGIQRNAMHGRGWVRIPQALADAAGGTGESDIKQCIVQLTSDRRSVQNEELIDRVMHGLVVGLGRVNGLMNGTDGLTPDQSRMRLLSLQ